MMRSIARRLSRRFVTAFRSDTITRDGVRWGYRLFLDREPESEAVIEEKLRGPMKGVPDLRRMFVFSEEFAGKNPDLAPFAPGTVVLKELPLGGRLFVDLSDTVIGSMIARGRYEEETIGRLPGLLEPGTVALDVGANIGFYAIQMALALGPAGRVVAFEPIEELAGLLRRSIAENGLEGRVLLVPAAVGSASGEMEIRHVRHARNLGASHLLPHGDAEAARAGHVRRVPIVAIDEQPLPGPVGFVKIDIEGAEPLFVAGARTTLQRDRPVILSEVHGPQLRLVSGSSANDYLGSLRGLGYTPLVAHGEGWRPCPERVDEDEIINVLCIPAGHRLERELALRR